MYTFTKKRMGHNTFKLTEAPEELAAVGQLYFERLNDDQERVSQYLGSIVVDLSTIISGKQYTFYFKDFSSKIRQTGHAKMTFNLSPIELKHLSIQDQEVSRALYSAADANLTWIHGFSPKGLASIVSGLKFVHAPYYVNHMGVTLPSGAFCMIPTTLRDNLTDAVRSHEQRFKMALARNCLSEHSWKKNIIELMRGSPKSKHIRCLAVVADAVTLHAKLDLIYTPDVQVMEDGTCKGNERWSVPREPAMNGELSYTGDCEDFAREVYQQCKEIRQWFKPGTESLMGLVSAVHHMYVPTIEQGAVDSEAHSKYVTYDAAYRNHIWAAMHPRHAWKTKMYGTCCLQFLYDKWPFQKCEPALPVLHLEGTGDVYPIATTKRPSFIGKMMTKTRQSERKYPFLSSANSIDMSLQYKHENGFYKYPIAFMTDIFKDYGMLDYTYITGNVYGVPMGSWIRGNYTFKPSTKHSPEIMQYIHDMIRLERPIFALVLDFDIVKRARVLKDGYYIRFGQRESFQMEGQNIARYKIDKHDWHEVYFPVDE